MKIKELIEKLQEFDPELEVAILDGFNGGGIPRTINLGPVLHPGKPYFNGDESADYSDLKSEEGTPTVHLGYGCY